MSLRRNTLWNLCGSAAPMFIGIAAVPFIYRRIGTERLGVITIIWALIGYFSIFDFGLGRAITQRVAASMKQNDEYESVRQTATTGVLLTLVIGILGAAAGLLALHIVGVGWINAKGLGSEPYQSLLLACIGMPATTTAAGMRGILEGFQQFGTINLMKFALGVSNFCGPVLSIYLFGPNLAAIVAILVVGRIVVMLAYYAATHQYLDIALSMANIEEAKRLFNFGGWMTLSNLISPLMVVADRFIISNILGAAVVAYYTVPAEFLIRLLVLPAAVTVTFFPIFSKAIAAKDAIVSTYYRKGILGILGVMGLITLPICAGSKWGLTLWLGSAFAANAFRVTSILAIGILFNSIAQVPFALIQASGNARATALIHVIELIVYLPLLMLMVKEFGITGAAIAWTIRALIDLALLHARAIQIKKEYAVE